MSKEEKKYTEKEMKINLISVSIVGFAFGFILGALFLVGTMQCEVQNEAYEQIQNSTEETSPKLILDKDIVNNTCIDAGADSGIISLSGNTYCIIDDMLEPVEIVCINEHCGIVGFEEYGE